jgi:hypothetical protein
MILTIDYYFNYKNTIRFLLIQKLSKIQNTYNIPKIQKIIYYFFFNKIEDLNDVELYNSFYYLNFFLEEKFFLQRHILFIL